MKKKINARKAIDTARMEECVRLIKEREQNKKELEKEINALKEEVKDVMDANNLEEMKVDIFTVRYKEVPTTKFNTEAFKAKFEALYNQFLGTTVSKRFTIS